MGFVALALFPPYIGIVVLHHLMVSALDTIEYVRNG